MGNVEGEGAPVFPEGERSSITDPRLVAEGRMEPVEVIEAMAAGVTEVILTEKTPPELSPPEDLLDRTLAGMRKLREDKKHSPDQSEVSP